MSKIINELLGYPKYKIVQDSALFHFSLDSMLLANFATINPKMHDIIDFCSGNGPIPMFLTLRTAANITAVEIQKDAYNLARESFELNGLEQKIHLMNEDVKGIRKYVGTDRFDLVLCNPPYFKATENSHVNEDQRLTIARHEILITLEDVIKEASVILKDGGYLAMVHRPDRLIEIFSLLEKYHLQPSRMQFVYPKVGKDANHLLIEARKGAHKNANLHILSPLFVYDSYNKWTNDVLKIYNYKKEE